MQIWQQYSATFHGIISSVRVVDVVDIIIVAYLVFKLLMLTWETRASSVLKGLTILLLVSWISKILNLRALNWIIMLIVNSGTVVVVVLFQPEIRRALERIGSGSATILQRIRFGDYHSSYAQIVSEMTGAMLNLSKRKVGALIVIEQKTGLKDVIESGTTTDAIISAQLLENIFEPNTPLHDGAVIIRDARIVAAACILTNSEDRSISRELGTRHRAGLGISETTDAIAFIISEETGIISMAKQGRLTRHLDANSLSQTLSSIFSVPELIGPLRSLLSMSKYKDKALNRAKRRRRDADAAK